MSSNALDTVKTSALEVLSHAADQHASRNQFDEYRSRKSESMRKAHRADLERFAVFLRALVDTAAERYGLTPDDVPTGDNLYNSPDAWRHISYGLIEAFIDQLAKEGYAVSTINRTLASIQRYVSLAFKAGAINEYQYTRVKMVKGIARPDSVNFDEQRKQQAQPTRRERPGAKKAAWVELAQADTKMLQTQPNTPQGRRDSIMVGLMLDLGLRCNEVAGLKVDGLNLTAGTIRFYRKKVKKSQTHNLSPYLLKALRTAEKFGELPATGYLLRGSRRGYTRRDKTTGEMVQTPPRLTLDRMSERAINTRVQEFGEKINKPNLSPHDLRHFWATEFYKRKRDILALQEAGGWSSLEMVRRYVDEMKIANDGAVWDEE